MTATKTVSGSFVPGGSVDYTVTISNTGTGTQVDNPGDEFTDTLPAQLTFRSASASSGSISVVGSTVKWNGSIPGGGNVKIVISAEVNPGTTGATVTNQGTVNYDPNHSGTNSSSVLTDDPGVGGAANPTQFVVAAASGLPRTFVASSGNDGESLHADEPVPRVPGRARPYRTRRRDRGARRGRLRIRHDQQAGHDCLATRGLCRHLDREPATASTSTPARDTSCCAA